MAHRPAAPATQSRGFSGPLPPSALRPPPSSAPLASGPGACIVTCFGPLSYPQRPVRPVPRHDANRHFGRHGLYGPGIDENPPPPPASGDRRRHQPPGRPAAGGHDPPLAARPARPASGGPQRRPKWRHGPSASSVASPTGPAPRSSRCCWTPAPAWSISAPTTASTTPRSMPNGTGRSTPIPAGWARWSTGCRSCSARKSCRAGLVANPGCYPTSAILPLAPLLKAGLIEPRGIIVDSKSGVSGAGRTPKLTTLFPECNESISAYNVGRHRHTPEIEQVLGTAAGSDGRGDFHAAVGPHGSRHPDHRLLPSRPAR